MTAAHLHLAINHIPLISIPVAMLFLLHSFWSESLKSRKFDYLVLVVTALAVLPVYFSGEESEDVVEGLAGVSESTIESHEEVAGVALGITLIAGASALFAYFTRQDGPRAILVRNVVIATSAVAVLSLAYAANLGGKIRHTELSGASAGVDSAQYESEELEHEDSE